MLAGQGGATPDATISAAGARIPRLRFSLVGPHCCQADGAANPAPAIWHCGDAASIRHIDRSFRQSSGSKETSVKRFNGLAEFVAAEGAN